MEPVDLFRRPSKTTPLFLILADSEKGYINRSFFVHSRAEGRLLDINEIQARVFVALGLLSKTQVNAFFAKTATDFDQELCDWVVDEGYVTAEAAQKVQYQARNQFIQVGGSSTQIADRVEPHGDSVTVDDLTEDFSSTTFSVEHAAKPTRRFEALRRGQVKRVADYLIRHRLGGGGMGDVFVALRRSDDKEFAIKVMKGQAVLKPNLIQRFLREAETMGELRHPNLVPVHDFGEDEGLYYLVMDLVDGISVDNLIKARGVFDIFEATRVVSRIARALEFAHGRGILHRDIKPANILIRHSDGEALVTDFGVAKNIQDTGEELTKFGQMVGTPRYMSPEQVRGEIDEIDGRSDVYSLGATFYEMLVAQPPYTTKILHELINEVLLKAAPSPAVLRPELPAPLAAICLKCLEKEPQKRYGSALELALQLEDFLGKQGHAEASKHS